MEVIPFLITISFTALAVNIDGVIGGYDNRQNFYGGGGGISSYGKNSDSGLHSSVLNSGIADAGREYGTGNTDGYGTGNTDGYGTGNTDGYGAGNTDGSLSGGIISPARSNGRNYNTGIQNINSEYNSKGEHLGDVGENMNSGISFGRRHGTNPRGKYQRGQENNFDRAFDVGSFSGGYQEGTVQASTRNVAQGQGKDVHKSSKRKLDNSDYGAGRRDAQERQGSLQEKAGNKALNQHQGTRSHQERRLDQNVDWASQKAQKQNDINDKNRINIASIGRYDRQDAAKNAGDKEIGQKRNAFVRKKSDAENIDYGFKKNFGTNLNERGGFKEAVGQDNTNHHIYEENQRDNRFSKGLLDAFRRSNDLNAFRKSNDWFSNAAQKQNVNNQFGAGDRLANTIHQKNVDFNSILDRKNDVFWHREIAQDKAKRIANDQAKKEANQRKLAQAEASGGKGVKDKKYYGGSHFGGGSNGGVSDGPVRALGTGGYSRASGSGANPYDKPARIYGGQLQTGNTAGVGAGGLPSSPSVKTRSEGSGGDYDNKFSEKARQSDLANQNQVSNAQSDAEALNDYNRGRGVDNSVELTGHQLGHWQKEKAGQREADSTGFNGAKADVAKAGEQVDKSLEARSSSSKLNAANKNLQAQELDRINWKRKQGDSNQRIRKTKKFYHDKNEDGVNNELLNYKHDKGTNDWGEEQQAAKSARLRYNNVADDAKANEQARKFENHDDRRVSKANIFGKQKDNAAGWKRENAGASATSQNDKSAIDHGKQVHEFDNFAQNVNNRNQKLWDQAHRNLGQSTRGSDKEKSLDAVFALHPSNDKTNLGLASSDGFSGQTKYGRSSNDDNAFFNGYGGGGGRGSTSFMDKIGDSNFGKTSFGSLGEYSSVDSFFDTSGQSRSY